MKKTLALSAVSLMLISASASAHLKIGTYMGTNPRTGFSCYLTVQSVNFDGVPHPLNERVAVSVANAEMAADFVLSHLPLIAQPGRKPVDFDHDALTGARGLSRTKSQGAVLKMSHEEGHEGPTELVVYQVENGVMQESVCQDLVAPADGQ